MSTERPKFPDKKVPLRNYGETTQFLKAAKEYFEGFGIGQKEATWIPSADYPQLPIVLLLMADIHYGSTHTNYELLEAHLKVVEDTPNFYLATNGDHVDAFNPIVHPSGMEENPITAQMQARIFMGELLRLDRMSKIAMIGAGNHDDFRAVAGADFWDDFAAGFQAPIFPRGGILNMLVGSQKYRMIFSHEFWGKSKINPNNATRRLIEYEGAGNVDLGWLGHTHQSAYEQFTKGGKQQVAVVSGTYKQDDPWAARHGIALSSGLPGTTLMLWPDRKRMEVFQDPMLAQLFLAMLIFETEAREQRGASAAV